MKELEKTISDERLDALLGLMSEEDGAAEQLTPPVINPYRLEREKERRQSDWQLKITAAAAVISAFLTTIATAILLRLLWERSEQLMKIPAVSNTYAAFKTAVSPYGQDLGALAITLFCLTVLGYLLCAALLVKNKDKLSALRREL